MEDKGWITENRSSCGKTPHEVSFNVMLLKELKNEIKLDAFKIKLAKLEIKSLKWKNFEVANTIITDKSTKKAYDKKTLKLIKNKETSHERHQIRVNIVHSYKVHRRVKMLALAFLTKKKFKDVERNHNKDFCNITLYLAQQISLVLLEKNINMGDRNAVVKRIESWIKEN